MTAAELDARAELPRTCITGISVPSFGDGGVQRLCSHIRPPEPLPEPEPEAEAEAGR